MKITYNPVNDYYDEVIKKNREEIKKCMTCPVCGNRVNNLDNGLESGIIPYKEVDYFENRNPETGELINKIEVNTDEEIPLTSCGYSQDNERLYLKVSKGSRNVEKEKLL